jgi:cell division protein FtsB
MSRNRMRNSQSLKWSTVLQIIVVVGLLLMLGVSYLAYQNHVRRLAQDELKLRKDLAMMEERNRQLSGNLARLKSPLEIERRMAALNLRFVKIMELENHPMDDETSPRARWSRPPETQNARF